MGRESTAGGRSGTEEERELVPGFYRPVTTTQGHLREGERGGGERDGGGGGGFL